MTSLQQYNHCEFISLSNLNCLKVRSFVRRQSKRHLLAHLCNKMLSIHSFYAFFYSNLFITEIHLAQRQSGVKLRGLSKFYTSKRSCSQRNPKPQGEKNDNHNKLVGKRQKMLYSQTHTHLFGVHWMTAIRSRYCSESPPTIDDNSNTTSTS